MDDNAGRFCISDGKVGPADSMEYPDITAKRVVYEVIRIIEGVPLFFEDHLGRMENSFKEIGGTLNIPVPVLKDSIKSLLEAEGSVNCNVKLTVYEASGAQKYLAYLSKSYYPGAEEISKGVPVGLLRLERQNPNAKVLNKTYREAVAEAIRLGGFFEVLLVNRDGRITEGSKSNVFFYKEGCVYTAPGSEVLKGITRKYVIEACNTAGFEVREKLVGVDGLEEVEGLFLSGTSIKVLPISGVDGRKFASADHPAIVSIRDAYDRLMEKYIERNVKIW